VTAERILAEIGADMGVFPTAADLSSWAAIAPTRPTVSAFPFCSRCS
jgi:transposase